MTDKEDRPLRVCLDARLTSGVAGGVEQVVIGLAHGLCSLLETGEDYFFLTRRGDDQWIEPHVRGRCRTLLSKEHPFKEHRVARAKRRMSAIDRVARKVPALPGLRRPGPPTSDGTIEEAGIDVMHFTFQHAFLTDVPSIFQPHDLQHVHLPRFFTPREQEHRERTYRIHCERARAVVVMSRWGKSDLVQHYDLPESKVHVIPWAPILDVYGEPPPHLIDELSARFGLPDRFALFPSHTHPHKNHMALLAALKLLRRDRIRIPLVCTGGLTPFYSRIRKEIERLGLQDDVFFLGFLPPLELHALYKRARCLVFPTLFEGWGMPVCEAFRAEIPVACSTATMLPDLAGDAALLFDPLDPEVIAQALATLWEDESTRTSLIRRGRERVADLSWARTASNLRTLYREVAGLEVSASDHERLDAPPV